MIFLNETSEFDVFAVTLEKIEGDGSIVIRYLMYPETKPYVSRPPKKKIVWNEELFFDKIRNELGDKKAQIIKELYEYLVNNFGEEKYFLGEWGKIRDV